MFCEHCGVWGCRLMACAKAIGMAVIAELEAEERQRVVEQRRRRERFATREYRADVIAAAKARGRG